MFGFNIRTRQTSFSGSVGSPRPGGTPKGKDSPKPEAVGEIDTRAPFQSVKAAVSLFGDGVSSPKSKPLVKKSKTPEERVLEKETQHHLTLKELEHYKDQLKNAENTKSQALHDLEKANRTLHELTSKLETVTESKQAAIEATESAKNRSKQLEEMKSTQPLLSEGGVWKQKLDTEREQYRALAGELNVAKQELTNLRQDFDAALDAKLVGFQEAADAEHTAKVNRERLSDLLSEIETVNNTLSQVKLASIQAEENQSKVFSEKDDQFQSKKKIKEEMDTKIQRLKEELEKLELSENFEEKIEETTEAIVLLQEQLKNVREFDIESLGNAQSELNDAQTTLEQVSEEEKSFRSLVETLKVELEIMKRDISEMNEKESHTDSLGATLRAELDKSKSELNAALDGETKAGDDFHNTQSKLRELISEGENAKNEEKKINENTKKLKEETEISRLTKKEASEKLEIALREAEEAKAAEEIANNQMHSSSLTDDINTTSNGKIKLSDKDFEFLTMKVEEAKRSADLKVATVKAQMEAINAKERETVEKLEESLKEMEDIENATKDALRKAEMDEAAKKMVEGELRKRNQKEQKNEMGEASYI